MKKDYPELKQINNTGKIKYSKIISAFAKPLTDSTRDIETISNIFGLAITVWNIECMPAESREDELMNMKKMLKPNVFDKNIELLSKRKQLYFSEYKFIVTNYNVTDKGDDFNIAVAVLI